ncbi:MAG TPA: PDZ domain-containing protein [Gemmatimonadaceae bacterium]|nr:PDZ domain-containing protein [Gemmatimonadaceae bacterium]
MSRTTLSLILLLVTPSVAFAQTQRPAASQGTRGSAQSAPIADVRYDVAFNPELAAQNMLRVTMRFSVTGNDPVLLSLPAWTPGAYEISNFARNVWNFGALGGERALVWDKVDHDTWRVRPDGARAITVRFDYRADSLDNAMADSRADFAFFNGTNVFLYPEGRSFDFPATVTITLPNEWRVATGMPSSGARTYRAANYHDLVDYPTFVGRFDLDSATIGGKTVRLATYPEGLFRNPERAKLWDDHRKFIPEMVKVFGDTPFDTYTTMIVFDTAYAGASALEHSNSHVGIYTPFIIGNPILPSITSHEVFHLWNVKRMRPADLWPYRYDVETPTVWLWVSEGVTDYYSDLMLVRGGVIDSATYLRTLNEKMDEVAAVPPVALEDASLSTWVHPTDGTGYIYYPKGALAAFLLDIMVRDASDNKRSLDDVLRDVYEATYKKGQGFGSDDWWGAVRRAAGQGGQAAFDDFRTRYIDGREPFPYARVLPLAGLRARTDTIRSPRIGVLTEPDSNRIVVTNVEPGSAADAAGIKAGDVLVRVGDIAVNDPSFGERYRARYRNAEGTNLPVIVNRTGSEMTLQMPVRMAISTRLVLEFDQAASAKAARVRHGILTGQRN